MAREQLSWLELARYKLSWLVIKRGELIIKRASRAIYEFLIQPYACTRTMICGPYIYSRRGGTSRSVAEGIKGVRGLVGWVAGCFALVLTQSKRLR